MVKLTEEGQDPDKGFLEDLVAGEYFLWSTSLDLDLYVVTDPDRNSENRVAVLQVGVKGNDSLPCLARVVPVDIQEIIYKTQP